MHALLLAVLLAQSGAITGTVLEMDGTPAAGRRVAALSAEDDASAALLMSIAETDRSGRYTLTEVPPGRYYITAGMLDWPTYWPGVADRAQAAVAVVGAGARLEGLDFRLAVRDFVKVSGRLVREADESAGLAHVEVRLTGTPSYTAMTAPDGSFEFPSVRRGSYQASAATMTGRTLAFVVGTEDVTGWLLRSAPGFRVSGHVIRGDVTISGAAPGRVRLSSTRGVIATVISADGYYAFTDIPQGSYTVLLDPPTATVMPSLTVMVRGMDVTVPDWRIPRGFRVAGKVIREDGTTGSAEVQLSGPARGSAAIGADGTFAFPAVSPGRYKAQIVPAPAVRVPFLDVVVTDKDVTEIRWVVPDVNSVDIRALLDSSDPLDQAWGGWLAGQGKRTELAPLLEKTLETRLKHHSLKDSEEAAIDTLTDALIQFDAKLPLNLAQALYALRPAQSLILLSRLGPSADEVLLRLVENQHGLAWFAAANLLLAHRAPGLTATVLKDLRISARVLICDPGGRCAGGTMGGGIGSLIGGGLFLQEFPPWPGYRLVKSGDLLAPGPVAVFTERKVAPAGSRPAPVDQSQSAQSPSSEERLLYVAAAAPGIRVPVRANEERLLEWQGREAADAAIESFRQDILARYAAMIQDLLAAGALNPREAANFAKPNLDFTVNDRHTPGEIP